MADKIEAILIRRKIIDTNAKVYHRLEGLYKENNSIKEKIENITTGYSIYDEEFYTKYLIFFGT